MTSSESPTHPGAPRAGGETPGMTDERAERLRSAIAYARTGTPHYYSDISIGVDELEALLNARASLLERHRDGERGPLGVPRDAVQCDWCHAIFALEYATDDGLCTFCGGCTYALSVILATASAPPSPERASK